MNWLPVAAVCSSVEVVHWIFADEPAFGASCAGTGWRILVLKALHRDQLWKKEREQKGDALWPYVVIPFLMNKNPGNTAWTRIEVLVRAPYSEVDIPIMQRERDVSDGMSEIPAAHTSLHEQKC